MITALLCDGSNLACYSGLVSKKEQCTLPHWHLPQPLSIGIRTRSVHGLNPLLACHVNVNAMPCHVMTRTVLPSYFLPRQTDSTHCTPKLCIALVTVRTRIKPSLHSIQSWGNVHVALARVCISTLPSGRLVLDAGVVCIT